MTRALLGLIIVLATGCVAISIPLTPSGALLARADRLVVQGEYTDALEHYDQFLAKYADGPDAPRARASRDTVVKILAARAELQRLRGEVTRLRAEVQKLTNDLEELKRIDLHLDRPRP